MSVKNPRFRKAEEEYVQLKKAFAAGRITIEECEKKLGELMVEHDGRHWMLGANSAKWYVWDGQTWQEAAPPGPAPVVAAPAVVDTVVGPAPVPVAGIAPSKTPTHKIVLGCLIGCASPLAFLAGVAIIVQTVLAGGYRSEFGMTLVALGVFLFALCAVALLPEVPILVFIIVYALWTLAGFIAMQTNMGRGFGYLYLPDNIFATGIVGLIGMLFGAIVRVALRPKV